MTFEDLGPSPTRVRMTFSGQPTSAAARLIAPLGFLFAGTARKQLQRDLDDMRAALEDGTGQERRGRLADDARSSTR